MDLNSILDTAPEPEIVDLQQVPSAHQTVTTYSAPRTRQRSNPSPNGTATPGAYWLPVPMCEYQRQLTDQIVSLHYSDILRYFETNSDDSLLVDSLWTCYANTQLVATHPYLLIDHLMPKLTTKDVSSLLCESSGKFSVLRDLFTIWSETGLQVALVANGTGRLHDMLEVLLLPKVNVKRAKGSYIRDPAKHKKKTSCTVHIMSGMPKAKMDFVVVLDLSSGTNTTTPTDTPTLYLSTINSIEHAALYFQQFHAHKSTEYLDKLTAAVVVLRDVCGVLPPDLRPIYSKNLQYLTRWLCLESPEWPLYHTILPIKTFTAVDVEVSLLNEVKFNKKETKEWTSYYHQRRVRARENHIPDVKDFYSDTLTHHLIHSMGNAYYQHSVAVQESQHFKDMELIQQDHERELKETLNKLRVELQQKKSIVENVPDTAAIDAFRLEIESLQKEVDSVEESEYTKKYKEYKELLQELKKETALLENNERKYMLDEISRAERASAESKEKIASMTQELIALQSQPMFDEARIEAHENQARNEIETIGLLQSEVAALEEQLSALQLELKDTNSRINRRMP